MVAVRLRQLVTVNALGDGGCTGHFEKEVHITREGFRNGDKGMGDGRVQIALQAYVSPGSGLSPVQHEGGTIPDAYTARTAACLVRQFAAVTQFQFRFLAVSQNHVVILPTQCHVFAQRNLAVVNTYCGVHILSVQIDIGEFDINGTGVGAEIAEEVAVAGGVIPSEGVVAAVYLEVAAAVHGRGVVVAAQRNECRGIGRGAARLQGVEQGVVCGDGDTFRHGLRYRIVLAARSKDYCCT